MKQYRNETKKRRATKWVDARRKYFKTHTDLNGYVVCEKCGFRAIPGTHAIFDVHDIYPYHMLVCEINEWDEGRLMNNMVILCRYCHLLCPHDEEDCKIWLSVKSVPLGPITAKVIESMDISPEMSKNMEKYY